MTRVQQGSVWYRVSDDGAGHDTPTFQKSFGCSGNKSSRVLEPSAVIVTLIWHGCSYRVRSSKIATRCSEHVNLMPAMINYTVECKPVPSQSPRAIFNSRMPNSSDSRPQSPATVVSISYSLPITQCSAAAMIRQTISTSSLFLGA